MATLRARVVTAASRALVRPLLARQHDPVAARAGFERTARLLARDPDGAVYRPDRLGGVPVVWAAVPRGAAQAGGEGTGGPGQGGPGQGGAGQGGAGQGGVKQGGGDRRAAAEEVGTAARDGPAADTRAASPRKAGAGLSGGAGVILYLHGGAFVMGSPRTHRALAARLAAAAGMVAVLPDYRLAPEHPFPAGLQDALAVCDALAGQGPVLLAGDSAGGGLALSVLAQRPWVAGLVAFSPFADLTLSGPSWAENAGCDALLPAGRGAEVVALYLQGAPAADPRASPLLARWDAPPPVLMFAARTEVLRDDALRMADRLRAAGGQAELRLAGDLPHVWPWLCPWLPEGCATLAEAGAFLAACAQEARAASGPPTRR